MPIRIAVLGGGPAGLTTALALERYVPGAFDVTLFDRNASETDYPGVEYGIQARACRALHRVGVKEAALARGLPNREIIFRIASDDGVGRVQGRIRTDPASCVCVVRQEFLVDLARLLTKTVVRRRTVVERIQEAPGGTVRVHTREEGQEGREERFDALVAADGVHSVVRRQWFAPWAKVHDRGFSCLYLLLDGRDHRTLPRRFRALANEGKSELILGRRTTWTLFPLGNDRLAVGVGFPHAVRDALWSDEGAAADQDWKDLAAGQKRAIALRLAADVPMEQGLLSRLLEDLVPDWDSYRIYLWAMRDSDPLPRPYHESASIVVIGDAAHAFMPTIGMGASLAIEDAEDLAARMAHLARVRPAAADFRSAVHARVFEPFSRKRVPIWKELMLRARWAGRANFLHARPRPRFAIAPQVPGYLPSRIVGAAEWVADRVGL
jgi:2-polyprenyl-6-methoxyphenol hydroxylase-like FAD-dependent oxidoreductase